jgi:REP element-mobilizing transposase RayT
MTMYRRRLPHVHQTERPVFLTWSLHGSLPKERFFQSGTINSSEVFAALERQLDGSRSGPQWLRQNEIAEIVERAILHGQNELHQYDCHAWVVMPNHVHLLLTARVPLPSLLASLKRITAKRANAELGRTGDPFWAEETFDRTVRNAEEFGRIRAYIENNPVKALFVATPEDYRWSSAWKGRLVVMAAAVGREGVPGAG